MTLTEIWKPGRTIREAVSRIVIRCGYDKTGPHVLDSFDEKKSYSIDIDLALSDEWEEASAALETRDE